jgi:hypothetical protein
MFGSLRHEMSSLARTTGPWFRIPLRAWALLFVLRAHFSLFVYRQPCDELIARPRIPTSCPRSTNLVKRKVSWMRPRPELGCRAKEKKNFMFKLKVNVSLCCIF